MLKQAARKPAFHVDKSYSLIGEAHLRWANGLGISKGFTPVADYKTKMYPHSIVSPLTRLGDAHPRADVEPGCAVTAAVPRK